MRRGIIGVVLAMSATSAINAVPAYAAAITGDQPVTGTAVAVITHDPCEDPDATAGLHAGRARRRDGPRTGQPGQVLGALRRVRHRHRASEDHGVPAGRRCRERGQTVAASPLGLGSDDGTIPGDGVTDKPAAEPNAFSAPQAGPTMTMRPHVSKVRYGLAELDQVRQEVLEAALPGGDKLRTA